MFPITSKSSITELPIKKFSYICFVPSTVLERKYLAFNCDIIVGLPWLSKRFIVFPTLREPVEYIPLAASVSLPVTATVFKTSNSAGAFGSFISTNSAIIVAISVTAIVRNIGDKSLACNSFKFSAYLAILVELSFPDETNLSHIALPSVVASSPNI